MSSWKRQLSELEIRSLARYVLDTNNHCILLKEVEDPTFMGEGLKQALYLFPDSDEYVFIASQKGYVMNVLLIRQAELNEFREYWEAGRLFPYAKIEDDCKKR